MKTILALLALIATSTLHAQTVTLTLPTSAQAQRTDDIPVLAGETLEVLAFLANTDSAYIVVNGLSFSNSAPGRHQAFQNVVIAGPATVYASISGGQGAFLFTYRKTVVASVATQNIPSQTVAIPENTIEPADVILESSTDLNSWISALPGSFTPSALKRFFRLRLVLH